MTPLAWEQAPEALITLLPEKLPELDSQTFHLVTEWPWANYITFISLTHLVKAVIPTLQTVNVYDTNTSRTSGTA